ncbi:hypothetical protein EOPP23_15755 [Endozoicomonas sp. OPT23]|uniref:HAD-IIA family hydrolase n=1 Tax=Endozoicomonas sp. OPT23 TaxID=2072845 RepID=UPI00129B8574|nr:HAD-IIA family hydrolase [Endozoicomonas sp. OPT23]MRI34444.1 hypothetical protein [Endozoicomonas sp. OPT23]
MVELTPDLLNQVYAKHLDWYPAIKNPERSPVHINGIGDILDQFDLVLLDSYGVLCRGPKPIEGAVEAIALMRERQKKFCVVSNDTMTRRSIAAEKYQQRGFDFSAREVLTSLDMTDAFLETVTSPESIGVIAPLEHPSNHLLEGMVRLNGCNGVIPDQVNTLLFLTGAGWTGKMQKNLTQSGTTRQFRLLVGNPDIGAPNGNKIVATPGYFLADFAEQTDQKSKPELFGKPAMSIFQQAIKEYGVTDLNRVLMVGDTLYTDILGGNAVGCKTLLLTCGVYQGLNIEEQIEQAEISPDFIADQL